MPLDITGINATCCINQDTGMAYVKVDATNANEYPTPVSGGAFSTTVTLPTSSINCTGTLNIAGTVISANQVQLVFSGTPLDCTGIDATYNPVVFSGSVLINLDGSSSCA